MANTIKIKLLKEVKGTPAGSVVEADEIHAKSLVADALATEWTKEVQDAEAKEVADAEQALVAKQEKIMTEAIVVPVENKDINIIVKQPAKNTFVDAVKGIMSGKLDQVVLKAPSGQNEGTAGEGGVLVYQGMDTLHGALMLGSVVYPRCEMIRSFGPNEYGRFIPYRDESTLTTTSTPRTYAPGEGNAKTPTKMAFNRHDLKLGTDAAVVYLTEEILSDVNYLEQYIVGACRGKLGWMADFNVLKGTYSAAVQGCIGVFDGGAANFYVEPVAHAATYTGVIIQKIISGVDPKLRAGAEWYMSNSMHVTLMGQLGPGTTVSTQPIMSADGKMLAGYPVNVLTQMSAFGAAGDILFGNFAAGYAVGQKGDIVMTRSNDVAFLTDEVVLRFTLRYLGAPTYRKYAPVDSVTVAAFSSTSGT